MKEVLVISISYTDNCSVKMIRKIENKEIWTEALLNYSFDLLGIKL